jgi:hypothetical protein
VDGGLEYVVGKAVVRAVVEVVEVEEVEVVEVVEVVVALVGFHDAFCCKSLST